MLVERTPASLRAVARPARHIHVPASSGASRRLHHGATASTASSRDTRAATSTRKLSSRLLTQPTIRAASSSTTSAPTPGPSSTQTAPSTLRWNEFLQLRKSRRRYNLVASGVTGLGTAFTGAGYLSTMDLNQLSGMLFGIDPMMALGLSTIACGALGWLVGPLAGSALFNALHRQSAREMLVKEKDFFHRINKYRADIQAAGNAQNNPFPDYYGEKINSVAGYRQWLRDQRKFMKKREYREK